METLDMLHLAATECLGQSALACNDVGLLLFAGVYRTEYLSEPALAALLGVRLGMNAVLTDADSRRTLAFDVFNGALGFLNACHVAQQMLAAGNCAAAMVVASETENNAVAFPQDLAGISQTASAVILDAHPVPGRGMTRIAFSYNTALMQACTSHCHTQGTVRRMHYDRDADLEDKYLSCIESLVKTVLDEEGLSMDQIALIFPPQISSGFIRRLGERLQVPQGKLVDAVGNGPDLFTSSIPQGMAQAMRTGQAREGDRCLILAVGSGIQAGCALYQF